MGIVRQQRNSERTSARVGKIAGKVLAVKKKAGRNAFVQLVYARNGTVETVETNLGWGEILSLAGTALNQVADRREVHRVSTSLEMARACIREQGAMIASLSDRLSRSAMAVPGPIELVALQQGKVSVNAVRPSAGLYSLSKAERSRAFRLKDGETIAYTVASLKTGKSERGTATVSRPKPRRRKS